MPSSIPSPFFARVLTEAAGFGIGGALQLPIEPLLQRLANETWRLNTVKPLDLALALEIAAEDRTLEDFARSEAAMHGVAPEKVAHALHALRGGPGVPTGLELWRRHIIDEDTFERVMWEARLEEIFHEPLKALRHVLIPADVLASMRQRGYLDRDEQVTESAKWGFDATQADLMFENSGLPPGFGELRDMLHRRIIDRGQFVQGIREANTKVKYTDELLELAKPILSPVDAANLRLRGWIDEDEAAAIGALSGYDRQQMQRLFLMRGRPASPTQGYTAWARGAPGPYGGTFDRADFDTLIRQSDIRPEYADVLWHNRFAYPSLFQLRRAVQDGSIKPPRARTILRYSRYEDQDADALIASWTAGSSGATRELTKAELVNEYEAGILDRATAQARLEALGETPATAEAQLTLADYRVVRSSLTAGMTKVRTLYVGWRIDRVEASNGLDALGVPATARDRALALWDHERELNRPDLTTAQVVKAVKHDVLSPADGLARLAARGYTDGDAAIILRSEGVTV